VQKGETHGPRDSGPLVLGPHYALPYGADDAAFNSGIVNSGHNPGIDILNATVQAAGAAAGGGDGATAGDAASSQCLGALLASRRM
jgi:hypothetical protein